MQRERHRKFQYAKSSLVSKTLEENAGAGQAGLRFLQFRDVKLRYRKAPRFDPATCARKRSGEDHRAAESHRVGRVRLRRIDVHPVVVSKWRGIKPRAICEQRVASKTSDG